MSEECVCDWCHEPIERGQMSGTYDGEPMHIDCIANAMDNEYDDHCMSSD